MVAFASVDSVSSRLVGCEMSMRRKEQPLLRTPNIATTVQRDFSKQRGMQSPGWAPASRRSEHMREESMSSSWYVRVPSQDSTACDSGLSRTLCLKISWTVDDMVVGTCWFHFCRDCLSRSQIRSKSRRVRPSLAAASSCLVMCASWLINLLWEEGLSWLISRCSERDSCESFTVQRISRGMAELGESEALVLEVAQFSKLPVRSRKVTGGSENVVFC